MGSGHNEAKFKNAILDLSTSSDWDEAKAEWELHFVYDDPHKDRSCKCEHSPIQQICVIKNRKKRKQDGSWERLRQAISQNAVNPSIFGY